MDLRDKEFTLVWPRELFVWEARRISQLESNLANALETLLAEAFEDAEIVDLLTAGHTVSANPAAALTRANDRASELLISLLGKDSPIRPHRRPQYWLERKSGTVNATPNSKPLRSAFFDLVNEMRELGYFPKVLPLGCVDVYGSWDVDPSEAISRAIYSQVTWPHDFAVTNSVLSDDTLYAVIEYFHDQARRPRYREAHDWNDCGFHYSGFNAHSGGTVYRWRVNGLLESYGVGFRLGHRGDEMGRFIRHADFGLDDLGDAAISMGSSSLDRTVAEAVELYRKRAATTTDRRAAIAQLANYLEKYRPHFKEVQFASGDEADLFNIFNNFSIRHGKNSQKLEYGDEYLDWIFWTSLAAIQLVRTFKPA